jgi:putative membrane protein
MNLNKYFTDQDRKEVEDAVKAVERVTSGEIVPVIVRQSSSYKTVELYFSMFFSVFFIVALSLILKIEHVFFGFYILATFVGFMLGVLLFKIRPVRRVLLPRHLKDMKVHQTAKRAFFENSVCVTRDRTGILIYISVFEKMVVVLGDDGINSKLKQHDWDGVVKIIVEGIKNGRIKDGIVLGIKSCSEMLQKHFPVKPDDVNELSDKLVIE